MLGKIFLFYILAFRAILSILFFLPLKNRFLVGFFRHNNDLDEDLGPPPITYRVPGYEKLTIKGARAFSEGARAFSDGQGMPGHYSDTRKLLL